MEAWVYLPYPSIPSRVIRSSVTGGRGGLDVLPRGLLHAAARGLGPRPLQERGLLRRLPLLAVLLDELFHHPPGHVVRILDRRRFLEVGGGPDERPGEAVVQRQLRAADRVDDHARRVRRV